MEPLALSPLTDEQANLIADQIAQTSNNVYRVAETILDRKLTTEETEPVYQHVEKVGEIFKCAECNQWKANSERTPHRDDLCCECDEDEDDGA